MADDRAAVGQSVETDYTHLAGCKPDGNCAWDCPNADPVPLAVPKRKRATRAESREALDPIARTLLDERTQRGLTGRDVTRAIGGSASAVSRWERGLSEPSLRRLRQWAASLGYDLALVPRDVVLRPGKPGAPA